MTTRLLPAALTAAALLAPLLAAPALAQAPDFGDDASRWANDGECDDPRFAGAGMAQTPLLDADTGHDATDCRAAFEAGTVALVGGAPGTPGATAPAPAAPPVKGGQPPAAQPPATQPPAGTTAATPAPPPAPPPVAPPLATPAAPAATPVAAEPMLGDDSSQWANDGECDDRRFVGPGMAAAVSWINAGRDATDCRAALDAGRVRAWDFAAARAATQCGSIDFGTDGGQFANDGECDDPRFEGFSMASAVSPELSGQDAADCSRLCTFGLIALRDY